MNTIQVAEGNSECVADTFISKIIGEMKHEFNKHDRTSEEDLDMPEESTAFEQLPTKDGDLSKIWETDATAIGAKVKESLHKPRIVILFKKPRIASTCLEENLDADQRPVRNKSVPDNKKIMNKSNLKRSSRRRSKDCNESVLQSAIARKEKSYNEASKPQRLTRQLKPTKKILENLAFAKLERTIKVKFPKTTSNHNSIFKKDGSNQSEITTSEKIHKNKHYNVRNLKTSTKRLKSIDSDKDCDSDQKDEESLKCTRRSQRIFSSRLKEELNMNVIEDLVPAIGDQAADYTDDPECSSVGAELIASRLCLCTQKSHIYASTNLNEVVHCAAIDNIGDTFIGCGRIINNKEVSRPSSRVPYGVFCDLHRNRLIRHNCCPTCGVFCTQGRYVECESKHQYHRHCQLSIGELECCPHCGTATSSYDVYIKMQSTKKAIYLPVQNCQRLKQTKTEIEIAAEQNHNACGTYGVDYLIRLKHPNDEIKQSFKCNKME